MPRIGQTHNRANSYLCTTCILAPAYEPPRKPLSADIKLRIFKYFFIFFSNITKIY